jgi:hypothetical protein
MSKGHDDDDAMPSRRTIVGLGLASLGLACGGSVRPAFGADEQIDAGVVTRLKGDAQASWNGVTRALAAGSNVYVGDEISTGEATRVEIKLALGTVITLGDHSRMAIAGRETVAEGAVIGILEGMFQAATHAIADLSRDALTVRTPTAVLGIRGTVVWGDQSATRLSVCMLSGTFVTVQTPESATVLTAPLDGTDIVPGQPPTTPKRWGDARVAAARATVAFD